MRLTTTTSYSSIIDSERSALAIDVRNLTKKYKNGKVANDHLSLQVDRGTIFGLLGPNGAGKTTLVLQILGLLAPTSGSIYVEGIDVISNPEKVKPLAGYMPQTRIAMRNLEVDRALYITGRLRGQSHEQARKQSEGLLEMLDLTEHRKQFIDRLSGGLLRVAAMGMALMGDPHLVVLDEPTNELDPVRRRMVWDVILGLQDYYKHPVTCLLVTHNVLEAERIVERVAIIDKGKVAAIGTPGELKSQLGDEVRLEVVIKPDVLTEEIALKVEETLHDFGRVIPFRQGQYAVFVPRVGVGSATDKILGALDGLVDDFRLSPPSLEDVYIHVTGSKIELEDEQ